jgi:hypothetical protein
MLNVNQVTHSLLHFNNCCVPGCSTRNNIPFCEVVALYTHHIYKEYKAVLLYIVLCCLS